VSRALCILILWHSTDTILRPWWTTWIINWRSVIVRRKISVDSIPVNHQRRSWKPWNHSLLSTNRRNGRVTPVGTIFLRLQSIIALMKIKRRLSDQLHNILSMNRISTLWRCIIWTTSLTISGRFTTSSMQALNYQQKQWWTVIKGTNNRIVARPPFRLCEGMPGRRCFSIESWMQTLQNNIARLIYLWPKHLSSEWWKTHDLKSRPLRNWPSGVQCPKGSYRIPLLGVSRELPTSQTTSFMSSI